MPWHNSPRRSLGDAAISPVPTLSLFGPHAARMTLFVAERVREKAKPCNNTTRFCACLGVSPSIYPPTSSPSLPFSLSPCPSLLLSLSPSVLFSLSISVFSLLAFFIEEQMIARLEHLVALSHGPGVLRLLRQCNCHMLRGRKAVKHGGSDRWFSA